MSFRGKMSQSRSVGVSCMMAYSSIVGLFGRYSSCPSKGSSNILTLKNIMYYVVFRTNRAICRLALIHTLKLHQFVAKTVTCIPVVPRLERYQSERLLFLNGRCRRGRR